MAGGGNETNLERGLEFLAALIQARIAEEAGREASLPAPGYLDDGSPLARLVAERKPKFDEFTVLMLALAPHVRPMLLDAKIHAALGREGDFPEIGGVRDADSRAFLPTGETAAFLLAGQTLEARFAVQRLFASDHWFADEGLLHLEPAKDGAPILSGRIVMARDWVERFTLGAPQTPAFGAGFPARRIRTALNWDDLVLTQTVREQVSEVTKWVQHRETLRQDWGMAGRLRPGYRALFYGPPGTGKTLTATLLGEATGREVYRVDLSAVVSKYIGETEENLGSLFDQAHHRDWILFFDEADALFGKRTGVKDSHDRYANQQVSYLLQRVEDFDGLVILASNLRANMDEAFLRRFNSTIHFPFPSLEERRAIWLRSLPSRAGAQHLAEQMAVFELSGGAIVNIVQFAAIEAIAAGRDTVSLPDALKGAQREIEKGGNVFRNLLEAELMDNARQEVSGAQSPAVR